MREGDTRGEGGGGDTGGEGGDTRGEGGDTGGEGGDTGGEGGDTGGDNFSSTTLRPHLPGTLSYRHIPLL